MVEEGDLDDKLEDKATNEVVDDVKKVAMEGVDKERKQVAMKVANTNCLDDLIDNALLLLFLLLDCRICIKRRCNSQTCCHLPHPVTNLTPLTPPPSFRGQGSKKISPKKISPTNFHLKKFFTPKNFHQKNFQTKIFHPQRIFTQKKFHPKNFHPKKFSPQFFYNSNIFNCQTILCRPEMSTVVR